MNQSAAKTKPFSDRRRWILFAAVSILFGLSMFYRSAIAVLTTDLMRDVPMDMGALGLVSAAFFYTYALFQIPGGILLDRFSPAKVMAAFYFSALAGVILFSVADSPGVMVLGRLLTGAGMACGFIGALKIISLQFPPDRFATLSGVVVSVGNMGIVVATTPLVLWAQGLGWRATFLLVGLFHLAVTLTFVFAFRDRRGSGRDVPAPAGADWRDQLGGLRLILRDRQAWLISWSAFIRYGILAAVQGLWAGPYLMDVMGYSPVTAGNLLFLLTLGVVIGNPVSGFLSDRVFKERKGIMVTRPGGAFPHAGRTCLCPRRCAALDPGCPFCGLRGLRQYLEYPLCPSQGADSSGSLGDRHDGPELFCYRRGRRLHAGAGCLDCLPSPRSVSEYRSLP